MTPVLSSLAHALVLASLAPTPTPMRPVLRDEPGREPVSAADANCERFYHLFRPMPGACLAPIDTDRPHQTDTPHVVDPGHAQFESAVVSLEADRLNRSGHRSLILGDNLYKVGLLNGVDIQVFYTTYTRDGASSSFGDHLPIRAKFQLWGSNRTPASLSFVPLIIAPLGATSRVQGGAQLFFGAELPAELDWELNAGFVTDHIEGKRRMLPIVATAFTHELFENFAVFGEGRVSSSDAHLRVLDTYLDTGALYHITPEIQVDAGGYFGVTGAAPALTLFSGLSLRK